MEHHSNIVPWQLLAERTGAKLAYVPVTGDDGLLDLGGWIICSTARQTVRLHPRFQHAGHGQSRGGLVRARPPRGIVTLVDAAQSVGHRPVDVQEIGCDFWPFPATKSAARPASACSMAGANCWKECRRSWAAAT
jgi:cysteine desulfurase/selenocysteine lyase